MGLFDYVTCEYPLPCGSPPTRKWQSKTTPDQYMDRYVIKQDGSLWHEAYEIEDRSDPTKDGLEGIIDAMTRVNVRWEQMPLTGEIDFHNYDGQTRVSYIATFEAGELTHLREGHL